MSATLFALAAAATAAQCPTAELGEPVAAVVAQRLEGDPATRGSWVAVTEVVLSLGNGGAVDAGATRLVWQGDFIAPDGTVSASLSGAEPVPAIAAAGEARVPVRLALSAAPLADADGTLRRTLRFTYKWDSEGAVAECDEENAAQFDYVLAVASLAPKTVDDLTLTGQLQAGSKRPALPNTLPAGSVRPPAFPKRPGKSIPPPPGDPAP